MVYLLHFNQPYRHARHYIGFTEEENLEERLAWHKKGNGARLLHVIKEAGISFQLARTWDGERDLEHRLKKRKNSKSLCPICRAEREKKRQDKKLKKEGR